MLASQLRFLTQSLRIGLSVLDSSDRGYIMALRRGKGARSQSWPCHWPLCLWLSPRCPDCLVDDRLVCLDERGGHVADCAESVEPGEAAETMEDGGLPIRPHAALRL